MEAFQQGVEVSAMISGFEFLSTSLSREDTDADAGALKFHYDDARVRRRRQAEELFRRLTLLNLAARCDHEETYTVNSSKQRPTYGQLDSLVFMKLDSETK